MNQYTCCLCGRKKEGHGHNPKPLFNTGKCCNDCNEIFVMAARFSNVDCMKRQIIYLNQMELRGDLPIHIITKKDEVWEYLYDCEEFDLDEEFASQELDELMDEANEIVEEITSKKEPFGPLKMQKMLQNAYDTAMENEAYEAAAIIWNRLKELKS